MKDFKPEPVYTPAEFRFSSFGEDAQWVFRRARDVAVKFDYRYIGTPHVLFALLEHNFTVETKLFVDSGLSAFSVRKAMLRLSPPGALDCSPRQATDSAWRCYLWAMDVASEESRLAEPEDLRDGLFRFREPPCDEILKEHGLRISQGFELVRA